MSNLQKTTLTNKRISVKTPVIKVKAHVANTKAPSKKSSSYYEQVMATTYNMVMW